MKKLLWFVALFALLQPLGFSQLDSNWQAITSYDNAAAAPYCYQAANVSQSGGLLILSTTSGSYTCNGHAASYATGGVFTPSFSFHGGVVKARVKFGNDGDPIWSALWMESGASGASGYPPTCSAALGSGADNPFGGCVSSAQSSYEIDIAESPGTANGINTNYLEWQSSAVVVNDGHNNTAPSPVSYGYHIYELDWYDTELVFKVDGQVLFTATQSIPPNVYALLIIDQEYYVTPSSFPANTYVDWVRVCSDPNAACLPGDATMVFDDEFGSASAPAVVEKQIQGKTLQGKTSQ